MVTFAQAQERAERWVNGGVPAYQHRAVRVREFDLGFVVWAEDRAEGPRSDDGSARLVIARDSGESTLWPGLPVGEVIRRYEEEYGARTEPPASPVPKQRVDLNATSFLLTPPEWLQEAADRLGIPDHRPHGGARDAGSPSEGTPGDAAPDDGVPGDAAPGGTAQGGDVTPTPASEALAADPAPGQPPSEPDATRPGDDATATAAPAPQDTPRAVGGWADTSDSGAGESVAPPATVLTPPLSGSDADDDPPAGPGAHGPAVEAHTELLPDGSSLPHTRLSPPATSPQAPPSPADDNPPHPAGEEGIAYAATSKVRPTSSRGRGPTVPPPPGEPGVPGAGRRPGTPAPGGVAGGYVPTQMMSAGDVASQGQAPAPAPAPGEPQQAPHGSPETGGDPTAPPPPLAPNQPGGGVHHAATMLAGPGPGPGAPPPPPQPAPPHAQAPPGHPPQHGGPGGQPPAYGYPQQPGVPMVGPGYMAVLRYRAPDGSEQQVIRRSAPGLPHPEWQILYELRSMNVPPQQVLELHTELEPCDLPGGYCARMIRETWPQVRVSHTAPYGTDHDSRQQGMAHLLAHQGELHQVADGPARPAPVRAPLHPVPQAQPVPPDAIGHELLQAFGPQGVFRFDQRAVSRQGVPETVAHTLVWAGLPLEFGPLFWAQAQPGRPVPTLAELAQERGVRPGPDAGSYLVMGSDFGRQLCVQYGTAHLVAVPLEAAPNGQPAAAQFVNTGLPEFTRCLAMAGRMWRLRYGLTPDQAGRWTVDFQQQLAALDPAALAHPENWWSVLLEQLWDGLL
ncbi:SUKH-4 family immunity protein [Streptomyces sp. JJ66]|uniref:SUKH-4 family immunity protein n=1 Tax=Streptomyces sp. JJ66 TaxID=2803843 RepID=UPI001C56BB38|nr:SUKH-4 family immunity protein [Streptomyces sp. JJ66]MBW1602733.1 SUKH-4 family immunity protein [Streptomyces sp. JJ66]